MALSLTHLFAVRHRVACGMDLKEHWPHQPEALARQSFPQASSRLARVLSEAGGVTTYGYDLDGELLSVTDPLNHTTTYGYSNRGWQTSVQNPLNQIVTTTYDTQGNKTTVKDARTNLSTFSYDALNRLTQIKDALNGLTSMVFDAVGNKIAAINALGARTSFGYDAGNRQTSVTDALNHTTTMTLDAVGNTTSVTDPAGDVTTFGFDGDNRQTSVQDPDGGIATTVYDPAGKVTRTIDQLNKTTTFAYDSVYRLTSTIDANGGTTLRTYDSVGNLQTLKDQVNNVTSFVYDSSNRLTSQTDPLGHTGTMAYDLANRLTSKTDAAGNVISYGYDAANRELGETWKVSGSTTNVVTFTYDANGNQLTASDSKGTYTMAYDALNRATVTNEPFGVTLTATYDAIGERTQVQDSFSGTTTFVFDSVGNLTSEKFGGPSLTPLRMDQAYDPRNQVTTITRFSDLAGTTKIGSTLNAYDPAGRITHHQDLNGGGTNIANYTYAYDGAGRITSEKLNGASPITYTYDNTGQLTNDGTTAYTYDAAGNRTMAGYATGTGNQITGQGAWSYGYDLNGNRTTKTQGPSFDTWTYQFDANNRLTSVQDRATSGGTLLSAVTYVYDVKGNRIEEDTWSSGGGNTVTRFAYDGQNAFVDLNSSNALVTRRLYQDGVDTLFARISAAGTAAWYLTDRLGSVRGMVDASGTAQATIVYDGFGNVTSNSNSGFTDRYLFTARELDSATGLQYNRARYYDPATGRWVERDPLGFSAGDSNLYRYVFNDPTTLKDPNGEIVLLLIAAAAGAGFLLFGPGAGNVQAPTKPDDIMLHRPIVLSDELGAGAIGAAAGAGAAATVEAGLAIGEILWNKIDPWCFIEGTLVLCEEGERPIESIEIGTRVWSYDFESNSWILGEVENTMRRDYQGGLVTISVNDQSITSTDDHPYWVVSGDNLESRPAPKHVAFSEPLSMTRGRWVDAYDLRLGDRLLLQNGGDSMISQMHRDFDQVTVFNLSIAKYHTFAVGAEGVLVHNRKEDIKQINQIAKMNGWSEEVRRGFGDFVEDLKDSGFWDGVGKHDTLGWDRLMEAAQVFKDYLKP
jgi:RHS repeat-associated protein